MLRVKSWVGDPGRVKADQLFLEVCLGRKGISFDKAKMMPGDHSSSGSTIPSRKCESGFNLALAPIGINTPVRGGYVGKFGIAHGQAHHIRPFSRNTSDSRRNGA